MSLLSWLTERDAKLKIPGFLYCQRLAYLPRDRIHPVGMETSPPPPTAEGLGTKELFPAVSLPSQAVPGPGWEMGSQRQSLRCPSQETR